MNIQRWKGIVWLGSLAVGGYLLYYVYDFWTHQAELSAPITQDQLDGVLDSVKKPPEEKSGVADYAAIQRVFHEHDWTGKEKVKVEVKTAGDKPAPPPKVAVSTLLKVLAVRVDTSKPEQSRAFVKFVDGKLATHVAQDDPILRPDERLFAPYEDVRVDSITAEGVVFAFDDPAREKETVEVLSVQRGEFGIVVVGPDGAILPQLEKHIADARPDLPPWKPEQLTQLRRNEWQVGTQTIVDLNDDYPSILTRDINCSTYKNPRTGATEGIKINRVAPNSIPAQAGLTEGEVLKSINGHKVTTVNDAIAFVKANANSTDTWTAVFDQQGREITRTYRSPPR